MKILSFKFRNQWYEVNEAGEIKANGLQFFSKNWIFLGGSSHHWHNRITISLSMAFKNPVLLNNCYGWDRDHGTTRQWGGQYNGKVPRISQANVYNIIPERKRK